MAHATRGAQGDARSAALFLKEAQKLGLYDQGCGDLPLSPPGLFRPSDLVLGDLDLGLLSHNERVELSAVAAIINRDGNIWALSPSELERVRELVGKGSKTANHNSANNEEVGNAARH